MRIGSLFSGIGGLELGLEWSGLGHTVWQVEQSEFCRSVLAKHWPSTERFEDVRTVGANELASVDLICGGFPCQDISSAGKGEGLAGSRSGLWFEYARIISELKPTWVVVENVASGAGHWVDAVREQLERQGYETLPIPISASDVGAPHRRKRIFIVAHASGEGLEGAVERGRKAGARLARKCSAETLGNTDSDSESAEPVHAEVARVQSMARPSWGEFGPPVPPVCGVGDGFPDRSQRLRALGNAVVPQCAEVIGWMIRELAGTA